MPRARKHLVCLDRTPYYHIVARCVRRAFLCGVDRHSGKSYEHRRGWIENRLRVLSSLFGIELCAYAVMSNHYHLVVKLTREPDQWSDDEVLDRWTSLFKGPVLVQQYLSGASLSGIELGAIRSIATAYRERLASLSWFMKCLNEPIARRANLEDSCTGHFWEARFRSQALCSERALISAMAYVDLNPVRAGSAKTPELSFYTSVRARLNPESEKSQVSEAIESLLKSGELRQFKVAMRPLTAFGNLGRAASMDNPELPIYEPEYLKLLDVTGRLLVSGKRGRIDPGVAPILTRLGIQEVEWLDVSTRFTQNYRQGDIRLRTAV